MRSLFIQLFCLLFSCLVLKAQHNEKLVKRVISGKPIVQEDDYKNFRFTLGGGYAYWLGKEEKVNSIVADKLSKDLRNGYNLDSEVQYFFSQYIGVGLNGNFVKHKAMSDPIPLPTSSQYLKARVQIVNDYFYLGPSCVFRSQIGKWGIYANSGLGLIVLNAKEYSYIEDYNYSNMKENKTENKTLGLYTAVAAEYMLSEYLGAGLKLALTSGTIKQEGIKNRISTSNLQVTGFLSFRTK